MTFRRLICGLATALLICVAPVQAAAAGPSSGRALFAAAARLDTELKLLGDGQAPFGTGRRPVLIELSFENSDGYTIDVAGFRQTVALSVHRAKKHSPTSTYLVHGEVTPTSIRASFGERGRIAVRFRPRADRSHPDDACTTPEGGPINRTGVFVGNLSFHGEGGYTSARVHRARGGSLDVTALFACLRAALQGHAGRSPAMFPASDLGLLKRIAGAPQVPSVPTHPASGPKPTVLVADDKRSLSQTFFATLARGSRRPLFMATEEHSEGQIGIVRVALVRGPSAAFAVDDSLSLAGVTPPAPFSGTATFQHGLAGAAGWVGSLAVSFPGAPDVPLVGPSFRAQLSRGF